MDDGQTSGVHRSLLDGFVVRDDARLSTVPEKQAAAHGAMWRPQGAFLRLLG